MKQQYGVRRSQNLPYAVPRRTNTHHVVTFGGTPKKKLLAAFVMISALLCGVLALPSSAAQAAEIPGAVTDIVLESPTQVNVGSIIKFQGTWSVPDSARGGDTFTLRLPEELKWRGATSFDLALCPPGGGACSNVAVANAKVSADGVVTFTLTDYVNDKTDVGGSFFFSTEFIGENDGSGSQTVIFGDLPTTKEVELPMADPQSSLRLTKSASPSAFAAASSSVGQEITYTFRVTNTGQQVLSGVTVTDPGPTRSGLRANGNFSAPVCAARPNTADKACNADGRTVDLLPGESTTYSATYILTQEDIDAGQTLSNTASATGTDEGGRKISATTSSSVSIGAASWGRNLGGTNSLVTNPQKYMWWQQNPINREAPSQIGAVVRSGFIPRAATDQAHTLTFTERPGRGLEIDCSTAPYVLLQPLGNDGLPVPIDDAEFANRMTTVEQGVISCTPEELVYTVKWISAASALPANPGGVGCNLYLALKVTDWSLAAVSNGGNGQGYLNTATLDLDGQTKDVTATLTDGSEATAQPPNNNTNSEKYVRWVDPNTEDQIYVWLVGPVTSEPSSTVILTDKLTTPGQRIDCALNADPVIWFSYWQLGAPSWTYQQAINTDGTSVKGTVIACSETSISVQVSNVPPLVNVGIELYVDIDTSAGRYESYGDEGSVEILDKNPWSSENLITHSAAWGVGSGLRSEARVDTVASTGNASDPKVLPYTGDDGVIRDDVTVVATSSGLKPNTVHTIHGVLFDQTTGALVTDRNGVQIFGTANSDGSGGPPTFTSTTDGESPSGGVPVYFQVPVELAGHTVVVYQYIFDDEDLLAAYSDSGNSFGYPADPGQAALAKADETIEIEGAPGVVQWSKVDATNGSAIAGASFVITGPHGYFVRVVDNIGQSGYSGVDTDQRPGYFRIEGLIPATNVSNPSYTVTEVRAPNGYIVDSTPITLAAYDPQNEVEPSWPVIENERRVGELSWAKSIAGNSLSRLPGSVWKLTGPDDYCELISDSLGEPIVLDPSESNPSDGSCSDNGHGHGLGAGNFAVYGLAWGSYTLVEVRAPLGYQLDPSEHHAEIDASHLTVSIGSIENSRILGKLIWSKIDDAGGAMLAGSVWELTGPNGYSQEIADNGDLDVDPAVGSFAVENLAWGVYTLTEKTAPEGYRLEQTLYTTSVDSGGGAIGNAGPIVNVSIDSHQENPGDTPEHNGALSGTGATAAPTLWLGAARILLLLSGAVALRRRHS